MNDNAMSMQEYEAMLKATAKAVRIVRLAAEATPALKNKLQLQALQKELSTAQSVLRRNYYEFENASKIVVETCDECGNVSLQAIDLRKIGQSEA